MDVIKLKNISLILPTLVAFFFLSSRGISVSAIYVLCLIGLLLVLFSKQSVFNAKETTNSWKLVLVLIFVILFVSVFFYLISGTALSYFESPYSIIWTMIPFLIFYRVFDKEESLIYTIILLFITSGIISYWLGGQEEYGARVISSRYFKLLYFAPLLVVFKWMEINWKAYLTISSLGVIGTLLVIVVSNYYYDIADGGMLDKFMFQIPVSGNTNPIFYGLISLCLAMPALLMMGFKILKTRYIFLLGTVFAIGLLSVLMSGSRGVWLTLFILLFVYFSLYLFKERVKRTNKVLLVMATLALGFTFLSSDIAQLRISQAFSDIKAYDINTSAQDEIFSNSLGTRMELWKASIKFFKDNALFGIGPGSFSVKLKELADKNELSSKLLVYNQAHSQYFHTLATKGIAGITILLVLYISLLWLPFKRIIDSKTEQDTSFLACCCMSVLLCYAALSLTESPFERRSTVVFFTFFFALSFSAMKSSELYHQKRKIS